MNTYVIVEIEEFTITKDLSKMKIGTNSIIGFVLNMKMLFNEPIKSVQVMGYDSLSPEDVKLVKKDIEWLRATGYNVDGLPF